jgi:hypothetical protein
VLWSISKTSRSFDAFRDCDSFAVNVLGTAQIPISQRFSSSATDKFDGIAWFPGMTGSPIIGQAICSFDCRKEAVYEGGDHVILVGRVGHLYRNDGEPLIFAKGRYATALEQLPLDLGDAPEGGRDKTAIPADLSNETLLVLIFHAFNLMSRRFEAHRHAIGLSTAQSRIITALSAAPGSNAAEIGISRELPPQVVSDTLAELLEKRHIVRVEKEGYELSPTGMAMRELIARRDHMFDDEQVAGIAADELAVGRRLLMDVIERNRPAPPQG